ncbi:MAG: tetratricopeptide repeat protein [Xanthobacteraceae bacterium]
MDAGKAFKYRAFISYSHADTRWTKWLHARLEAFRIDRDLLGRGTQMGPVPESLRPIFRDRDEFSAGQELKDQTVTALSQSAALVVVCSPHAARSHYVNEEIRLFKASGDRPVIPVIVDGEPEAGENDCFPRPLRYQVAADGTITDEPIEPLAADVREQGDGKNLALAKIVARLLGLQTDEIFRRAERERRKEWRIRAGVSSLICALLVGGVGVSFLYYRNQQALAEVEKLVDQLSPISEATAADTTTKKSLTEAITEISKWAVSDSRYKQALDLLKAGKREEAEQQLVAAAEANVSQAAARFRYAGAIAGLGDPRKAREYYGRALALDPDDPDALYWHGFLNFLAGDINAAKRSLDRLLRLATDRNANRSMFLAHLRLGEVALATGNLAGSFDHEMKAAAIAKDALAAEPNDTDWQINYSITLEKIADALLTQGDLAGALEDYRASERIRSKLATAKPDDPESQRILAISQTKVGDVLQLQGALAEALQKFNQSLAIRRRFAGLRPTNVGWQRDLSISDDKIGTVERLQSKLDAAIKDYQAASDIRERLSSGDPGNAMLQFDVSISDENIGDIFELRADISTALDRYRAALSIRNHLVSVYPNDVRWQRDLSVVLDKVGDSLRRQGKLADALATYSASLAIRDRLAKDDPRNAEAQLDLAMVEYRLGGLEAELGNKTEALRVLRAGREILAPLAQRSKNPVWLTYLQYFDADIAALR